ncbi:hypothetical protein HMPREF9098_1210 [Kingella denitrificans ATCC 33394]|uniref:Uncharacterized protein n=1 Tax=Kingella denitrificans ATCC 33394 TaxID=888741 RepID=F0EZC6_9NEIS|nr:hypothetical protein HMPREF9098_1210 [Kingella denitrificans ATCC 33394]
MLCECWFWQRVWRILVVERVGLRTKKQPAHLENEVQAAFCRL